MVMVRAKALVDGQVPDTKRSLRMFFETSPWLIYLSSTSGEGLRFDGFMVDIPDGLTVWVTNSSNTWSAYIERVDGLLEFR